LWWRWSHLNFLSFFTLTKVFYLYYGQQNQILDKGSSAAASEPACTDQSVAATLGLSSLIENQVSKIAIAQNMGAKEGRKTLIINK